MLASITPLGERGRQATWAVTVTAFLLGALGAAAGLGAALGLLGSVLPGLTLDARLAGFGAAALAALAIELGPFRVPGPDRQVNERWLDEYRGWVYGLGYGGQLGLGITTVVSSTSTYLAIVAAVLSREPALGALIFGAFGLARGLTPLAAAWVRQPQQLMDLHRWLSRRRADATMASRGMLAVVLMLATGGALS
jgi:hypothetical protein